MARGPRRPSASHVAGVPELAARERTYDQWRDIRFRPERRSVAATRSCPFQVQFFHPGLYYDRPVAINVVDRRRRAAAVRSRPTSSTTAATTSRAASPRTSATPASASTRRSRRRTTTTRSSSSSARPTSAPSARTRCSASRRAASPIDTALPSGEEFPYFREFWLVTPAPKRQDADHLRAARQPER